MNKQAYSRTEIDQYGNGFPKKGIYCPKCKTYIPVFEDMTDELRSRVLRLIRDNKKMMAMAELRAATGCSERWAKIWVLHGGRPTPEYPGPPCPYCGKPLRTSLAKQCPHCLKDWHNEE
jgi:hypothetical protein